MDTSAATKRRILMQRLGDEPQPAQEVVRFRAERDPMAGGAMWYRVVSGPSRGVAYRSLKAMRDAFPEAQLARVKATRANRLFA